MKAVQLAALLTLAAATSAKVCQYVQAPKLPLSLRLTCSVPHTDGADDSVALNKLMADPTCSNDATVVFDEDTTYNISLVSQSRAMLSC